MKKVITAKDLETILSEGRTPPDGAILTPGAKDLLRESSSGEIGAGTSAGLPPAPELPDFEYRWDPAKEPKTPVEIQRFYESPAIRVLRERMCAIGERIWQRGYVDGNGGNLTIRVGENLVLCTPTLVSKGFMKPDEMCLVDLDGNQKAGSRPRTSEVNTHLAIMKKTPKAKSCVHAHPPHATAFAVASVEPPSCVVPEADVFLGKIAMAKYETPGTPENAKAVGELAEKHQAILMELHGVITWGKDIEDAYWKLENVDALCQTVWMASQLGRELKGYGPTKLKELIAIRRKLGMPDDRENLKECELCDTAEFRPGVMCSIPSPSTASDGCCGGDSGSITEAERDEMEQTVQRLTDEIMKRLS